MYSIYTTNSKMFLNRLSSAYLEDGQPLAYYKILR
jgi:hypothetical protein